jgi:short-subunit dehydrogenase
MYLSCDETLFGQISKLLPEDSVRVATYYRWVGSYGESGMKEEQLEKREGIVLVTGASSGLGRSIASLLCERGFTVFGTSRHANDNSSSGEKSNGFGMLPLDVDSDESVRACLGTLLQKSGGRLDVLINNAGYGLAGAIEETSIREAKLQFETNFFGVARMVKEVLPIMRKQTSGRIINVGSLEAVIPAPFTAFYAAAKAALRGYSEVLRQEVRPFGIKVSLVEPGFFRTNILNSSKYASETIEEYGGMRKSVFSKFMELSENGLDPIVAAETILSILESKSPRLSYRVGKESKYATFKRILPERWFEAGAMKFWGLEEAKRSR